MTFFVCLLINKLHIFVSHVISFLKTRTTGIKARSTSCCISGYNFVAASSTGTSSISVCCISGYNFVAAGTSSISACCIGGYNFVAASGCLFFLCKGHTSMHTFPQDYIFNFPEEDSLPTKDRRGQSPYKGQNGWTSFRGCPTDFRVPQLREKPWSNNGKQSTTQSQT